MDIESVSVDLLENGNKVLNSVFRIYEEDPENKDNVILEIHFKGKKIVKSSEDFFSAMQAIRTDLELKGIFMQCNGAAKNVYPSPMQRTGRTAYVLELCCPAKLSNVVDIFETREGLDFVTVEEQDIFYKEWLSSLQVASG